jgi:hypothetical protein
VVSKSECPEYHTRIAHPLDLTTLATRAHDGTYDEGARGIAGLWDGESASNGSCGCVGATVVPPPPSFPRSRLADVCLLIKNAKVFNQPERVEWVMADVLELTARKLAKRYCGTGGGGSGGSGGKAGAGAPPTPSKAVAARMAAPSPAPAPVAVLAPAPAPATPAGGASSSRSGVSGGGTPAAALLVGPGGRARGGWVTSCGYGSDTGSVGPSGRSGALGRGGGGGGGWDDIDAAGLE